MYPALVSQATPYNSFYYRVWLAGLDPAFVYGTQGRLSSPSSLTFH